MVSIFNFQFGLRRDREALMRERGLEIAFSYPRPEPKAKGSVLKGCNLIWRVTGGDGERLLKFMNTKAGAP
jgi:hypothetical protein